MIFVRKAQLSDIQELVKFLIKNGLIEEIHNNEGDYYVCKNDDIIYGCGMMVRNDDYCIIKNVIVNKGNRREKLGSAIVKTMLNSAELSGASTAICIGDNKAFSEYLNFKLLELDELPDDIKSFIKDIDKKEHVYITSLIDYFKSSCQ